MSLPTVTIIGTLTADPELRFVGSEGNAVASFTVAANERKKTDRGWEDGAATFVRCSIWRQPAENLCESVSRGDRVFVMGRLKQREFEKDGQKRTVMELDVDEVGPTTRFATTSVNKVSRSDGGGGFGSGQQPSSGGGGGGGGDSSYDDPWSVPAGGSGAMDPTDPPFAR